MHSGQLLAGRYRLDDPIAAGGMGDVWRATDNVLGRRVAIKVLRAERSADRAFGARFRAEARMLAALHHPGVVDVYDYGEISSEPRGPEVAYLVMAFVALVGTAFAAFLAAVHPGTPSTQPSVHSTSSTPSGAVSTTARGKPGASGHSPAAHRPSTTG